ncbi:MAG: hydroxyacid dehydrogenase [Bacteroidales bacterium]|nr:hydroxyacid dehydrogenase [Bacteroidales bacterium]
MIISCVEPLGISKERFEQLKKKYSDKGHAFNYFLDRNESQDTLIERMHDADVVVVSNIKLPREVLEKCTKLKYLSVAFTGLDHIDLDYCREHGIEVQNAAGYSTTAVSELAVGMMIDLLRQVTCMDGVIREGKGRGLFLGRELKGKTVGIVGTGAIGTATIRLLLAFGCKVIAYSRSRHKDIEEMGVKYVSLEELMKECDIVSLHVPMNNETRGLVGKEQLNMMKPTALLVNTARGLVCDIHAVAEALKEGTIAGAAFDVFEQEPPLPLSHCLLDAPNCLLTPHIAFATEESFAARADIVFGHIDQWLSGK